MQESIKSSVRILGKMCQQCVQCQDGMEKGMLFGAIGEAFLKYEDYFASSCERELLNLQEEYVQFERFVDEATEACFGCNGKAELIYIHAAALIDSLSSKTASGPSGAKIFKMSDAGSKSKS